MVTSKMNIGLAPSRNFDKISLEFQDEPITYSDDEELRSEIQKRFKILREEINKEFEKIQ